MLLYRNRSHAAMQEPKTEEILEVAIAVWAAPLKMNRVPPRENPKTVTSMLITITKEYFISHNYVGLTRPELKA